MAAPDPLHIRGYEIVSTNHADEARRALERLSDGVSRVSVHPASLADAQRLVGDLSDLIAHLAALKALDEVAFLAGKVSSDG